MTSHNFMVFLNNTYDRGFLTSQSAIPSLEFAVAISRGSIGLYMTAWKAEMYPANKNGSVGENKCISDM